MAENSVVSWVDTKVDCSVAMLGWMLVEMLVGLSVDEKEVLLVVR